LTSGFKNLMIKSIELEFQILKIFQNYKKYEKNKISKNQSFLMMLKKDSLNPLFKIENKLREKKK
jgi:hypothetical protein